MFTSIVLSLVLTFISTHTVNFDVQLFSTVKNQTIDTVVQKVHSRSAELDLSPGSQVIKRALKGYSYGLTHHVEGVVESAIYQVMILSVRAPEVDLSKLESQLKEMSTSHPLATIRIRAFLAVEFLTNDSYRQQVEHFIELNKGQQEPAEIFKNISDRLADLALKRAR